MRIHIDKLRLLIRESDRESYDDDKGFVIIEMNYNLAPKRDSKVEEAASGDLVLLDFDETGKLFAIELI
jgi:uncharacterized protein YuzE